jgi:hypothetical protein
MGAFTFDVDDAKHTLTCEFTVGRTHGLIEFLVDGETMTGTLVVLPERTLGRRIRVHRADPRSLPAAPPASEYAEP